MNIYFKHTENSQLPFASLATNSITPGPRLPSLSLSFTRRIKANASLLGNQGAFSFLHHRFDREVRTRRFLLHGQRKQTNIQFKIYQEIKRMYKVLNVCPYEKKREYCNWASQRRRQFIHITKRH